MFEFALDESLLPLKKNKPQFPGGVAIVAADAEDAPARVRVHAKPKNHAQTAQTIPPSIILSMRLEDLKTGENNEIRYSEKIYAPRFARIDRVWRCRARA